MDAKPGFSRYTFAVTPPELPCGGVKQSGFGRAMGGQGLLEHSRTKAVIRAACKRRPRSS